MRSRVRPVWNGPVMTLKAQRRRDGWTLSGNLGWRSLVASVGEEEAWHFVWELIEVHDVDECVCPSRRYGWHWLDRSAARVAVVAGLSGWAVVYPDGREYFE